MDRQVKVLEGLSLVPLEQTFPYYYVYPDFLLEENYSLDHFPFKSHVLERSLHL